MVLPVLRLAGAAVTGLWAVTELRRPVPPPERDRTLAMRVAHVLPAAEAPEAHRLLDAGGLRGRIILDFPVRPARHH